MAAIFLVFFVKIGVSDVLRKLRGFRERRAGRKSEAPVERAKAFTAEHATVAPIVKEE